MKPHEMIFEKYELVITEIRNNLIRKHEENMRRLDAHLSEMRSMLVESFNTNPLLSVTENKNDKSSSTRSSNGSNHFHDYEKSSSGKNNSKTSQNSSTTSQGNATSSISSNKAQSSSNHAQSTPSSSTSQNQICPVKFKILRNGDNNSYQLQNSAKSNKSSPQPTSSSSNSSRKRITESQLSVDDSPKKVKLILKNIFDQANDDRSNPNLDLPEPDPDNEDFGMLDSQNDGHSSDTPSIDMPRIKTEYVEDAQLTEYCVFCKKNFAKCGIGRHTERCWKQHGGQSSGQNYCAFENCTYSVMKSKYSHLYARNHVRTKHKITDDAEIEKYVKRRNFIP